MIAAARAGLKRVMLPARNQKDYEDIPQEVREQLEFIWLERVEEAALASLETTLQGGSAPGVSEASGANAAA